MGKEKCIKEYLKDEELSASVLFTGWAFDLKKSKNNEK